MTTGPQCRSNVSGLKATGASSNCFRRGVIAPPTTFVEAAPPPKDAVSIAASSGLKADGRSVSTSWGPLSVSYLDGTRSRGFRLRWNQRAGVVDGDGAGMGRTVTTPRRSPVARSIHRGRPAIQREACRLVSVDRETDHREEPEVSEYTAKGIRVRVRKYRGKKRMARANWPRAPASPRSLGPGRRCPTSPGDRGILSTPAARISGVERRKENRKARWPRSGTPRPRSRSSASWPSIGSPWRVTSRSSDPEFRSGGGAGTGGRAVRSAGGTARTAQLEVVGWVRLYSVVPSTVWAVK